MTSLSARWMPCINEDAAAADFDLTELGQNIIPIIPFPVFKRGCRGHELQ